jgi:hypothetical protein
MESGELWPWRDEARGSGDGGEFLMPAATLHWRQLADDLWMASTPAHDYMAIDLSATSSVPGYPWLLSRDGLCTRVSNLYWCQEIADRCERTGSMDAADWIGRE